jgi:hypothetical protein
MHHAPRVGALLARAAGTTHGPINAAFFIGLAVVVLVCAIVVLVRRGR